MSKFINLKSKYICVVGDLMLDRFISGNSCRISQEAPVPVVDVSSEVSMLGGAGNVANNIYNIGARVSLVGVVGDDRVGSDIVNMSDVFEDKFILSVKNRVSTEKIRIISQGQQIVRIDKEQKNYIDKKNRDIILNYLTKKISYFDVVVLSDYAKGCLDPVSIKYIIKLANKYNKPIISDIKPVHKRYFKGSTIITPNLNEALTMTNKNKLNDMGFYLMDLLKSNVIITQGSEGMTLFELNKKPIHFKAENQEVYDVTGAGDTVVASLAVAMSCNISIRRSVMISNKAAGIVVGMRGTSTISNDQFMSILNNN